MIRVYHIVIRGASPRVGITPELSDLGGDLDVLAGGGGDVVLAKVSYWFTP